MAQQERAVRTRQAILEAAGAVFAERGYGSTRISDVYQRAGMTKGAFYFHFSSKEQLAQEVLDTQMVSQTGHLPGYAREVKLQEAVDSALLVAHRLHFDSLLQGSIRLSIDQGSDLDRRPPYQAWVDFQTEVLGEAKERGELLPDVDVRMYGELLVGVFSGVQIMSGVMTGWDDLEERIANLYSILMPLIATPETLAELDISPDLGRRLMAEREA
ncbi:ScbR family autoregulator-binding transcription factor [Streptomyces marianii]|uniref:TetR/AcrR family transcriptional regulator n=1 Tax=Streptomyces marianii TaxID=1817406 RepID=A0A5R9DZ71_9ACTN|nr:ScbR family autoregulator-binding transcription factor [Streptomyces marianii]TLQ42487.1 TetR/AcrR family transcriptional regulator [Streptomyces marianii]